VVPPAFIPPEAGPLIAVTVESVPFTITCGTHPCGGTCPGWALKWKEFDPLSACTNRRLSDYEAKTQFSGQVDI
jgi:hypothetical protein